MAGKTIDVNRRLVVSSIYIALWLAINGFVRENLHALD